MKKNTNLRNIANASLALLISALHGAGAMEDGEDPRSPDLRGYQEIHQEIQALTTRIEAEVDQVLAAYRHDMAAYHRRMGAPAPKPAPLR